MPRGGYRARGKRPFASTSAKIDLKVNYEPQQRYPPLRHPAIPLKPTPSSQHTLSIHHRRQSPLSPNTTTNRISKTPSKSQPQADPFTALKTYTCRYTTTPRHPRSISSIPPKYLVSVSKGRDYDAVKAFLATGEGEEVGPRSVALLTDDDPKSIDGVVDWSYAVPPELLRSYTARQRAGGGGGRVNGRAKAAGMDELQSEEEEEEGVEEQDDDFEEGEEEGGDDYNAEMYFDNGEDGDLDGGEEGGGGFDYD